MAADTRTPAVHVVTGVSGSGKTTVGRLLAERLGVRYADADDFQPPANVARMAAGQALDDAAREPWLGAIGRWIDERAATAEPAVVSCSALKRAYRDVLRAGRPQVRIVYLRGSRELIAKRLAARRGHFFPARLLDTQFAALEEPTPDEGAITVSVETATPQDVVGAVLEKLRSTG